MGILPEFNKPVNHVKVKHKNILNNVENDTFNMNSQDKENSKNKIKINDILPSVLNYNKNYETNLNSSNNIYRKSTYNITTDSYYSDISESPNIAQSTNSISISPARRCAISKFDKNKINKPTVVCINHGKNKK
jgi:hypothetical protein